jgi:hypothetical protein
LLGILIGEAIGLPNLFGRFVFPDALIDNLTPQPVDRKIPETVTPT